MDEHGARRSLISIELKRNANRDLRDRDTVSRRVCFTVYLSVYDN